MEDLFGECFSPVTYGGGITTIKEADKILKLGAEKICLNSSVLKNKMILKEFSNTFGSQSIVVSIEVKKKFFNNYLIYNNYYKKFEKKLNLKDYIIEFEELEWKIGFTFDISEYQKWIHFWHSEMYQIWIHGQKRIYEF